MKGVIHPELVAELREARIAADRVRLELVTARARIEELEQENEAQREFIAVLSLGGEGAAL